MVRTGSHFSVVTYDESQTRALGARIGRLAKPGMMLALIGDLGSGKTCFTRGLAEGLRMRDPGRFSSPSFTLMNQYDADLPVYHFDFYRLESVAEILDLGFTDYLDGDGVVVVEWADKLEDELPEECMVVEFAFHRAGGDARLIRLIDGSGVFSGIMEEVRRAYPGD
ncbi:tRNA (adenosine(37)-N6)-threonylcarbamoyltransferase complex ATPase subunit type 1 TsaE [bacterium]|nr:tRNA (adenosine(37)-N6)-threonylcarbamoyltransferase complex ATPase subunit type 1 TsaE [candidate division CSSED10-310 bacterium]